MKNHHLPIIVKICISSCEKTQVLKNSKTSMPKTSWEKTRHYSRRKKTLTQSPVIMNIRWDGDSTSPCHWRKTTKLVAEKFVLGNIPDDAKFGKNSHKISHSNLISRRGQNVRNIQRTLEELWGPERWRKDLDWNFSVASQKFKNF